MFSFHVGPFPVKVSASFLLLALLLGFSWLRQPWQFVAWIFVVFVSVLVHELGHALVGRALGGEPEIHLEGLGGLTFPNLRRRPTAIKSILLSFAGPFFGLVLGIAAWGLQRAWPPGENSVSEWIIEMFQVTSVIWAVFNLLPMLPLDGGNILLAALEGIRKKPSLRLAGWISAVVAAAAGLWSWSVHQEFMALWCAMYAIRNVGIARADHGDASRTEMPPRAQQPQAGPTSIDPFEQADVQAATERAREALRVNDVPAALVFAERLEQKGGAFRQAAGLRLRAGIELARGDNDAAALYAGQSFSIWQTPDAAVVAARANLRSGQLERAKNWLRRALEAGASPNAVRDDPELAGLTSAG